MEELGNIAVFLAGWNSEYQTRLINGIIRKAKEANYAISIFTRSEEPSCRERV